MIDTNNIIDTINNNIDTNNTIDTTNNNIHDCYQQYIYLNMQFLSKLMEDNNRWVWLVCTKY